MPLFLKFFERLHKMRQRVTRRSEIGVVIPAVILLIATGTIVYALLEDWSLLDALYATIITITTVGYGDLTPQSTGGRIFAIFFTLVAIGIGGYAISSLAAFVIDRQANLLSARLRRIRMSQINKLNQHMIVCGSDSIGRRIAKEFHNVGIPFVIIEPDEGKLKQTMRYMDDEYYQQMLASYMNFEEIDYDERKSLAELAELAGVPYILDDPMNDTVIVQAGIARARGLVTALSDDRSNLAVVVGARALSRQFENEGLRIMTRVEDERFIRKMYLAGANDVRVPAVMGGHQIASHMMNPELGNWWYKMNTGRDQQFYDLHLRDRPAWIGKTIMQVFREDREIVIALQRKGEFASPPDPDVTLQPDDTIVLLGSG